MKKSNPQYSHRAQPQPCKNSLLSAKESTKHARISFPRRIQAKYHYCYSVYFLDLFTTVYINNPRLTLVEKMFHILTKTTGEAKGIVSKYLTNVGFASACEALQDRFQNKRLLVKSHLKLLLNLNSARVHSHISTDNWDWLLVFLCASKLPKLTLSFWE